MTTIMTATNPLLCGPGLPRFAEILPEHLAPALTMALETAKTQFAQLEQHWQPTWAGIMEPLERLEQPFDYIWKPVSHLLGVKNSPELRTAYEAVLPQVIEFSLQVRQCRSLYDALRQLRDGAAWNTLDEAQQRIVADRIKDAELSGIALPEDQRARFNAIEQELSQICVEFSNHVLDATKAYALDVISADDVQGIPLTARRLASAAWSKSHADQPAADPERGPWRFTLEQSSFGPFMEHCRNRGLREAMYRAFVTRASHGPTDNTLLMNKILSLRQEKARLLGYPAYSGLSLTRKMAPSVAAIRDMLERLRQAAWSHAEQDLQDIVAEMRPTGIAESPALWDVAYYAERLRERRYAYSDEQLRPYFPFERVLDGLFRLAHQLFGITVRRDETGVSLWHPDVRFYQVLDGERPLAAFYLDPYSRPENKRGGAWMDDCLGLRKLDSGWQLPVAHLVCNQTPPTGDQPSLMTFREVETLFHEFGHGLQHMLTTCHYPDASGISGVEWDAVELPSQFMENWCYCRPVLLGMTGHYQTGEPLPEELFEKIVAAKNFRSGSMMLRQIQFGLVDLALHTEFDPAGGKSAFDVQREIATLTSVLPLLPDDRSLCSFQHIFSGGYAAGYYSYKWAEVLSADAFSAFEDAGLDRPDEIARLGRRFRETVLSVGGGRHPMTVFKDFRGREPAVDALLRHSGLK